MKTCSDHPQNKCKIKKKNTDIKRNRILALLIVLTLSLSASVVAISGYDDNNINGAVGDQFDYTHLSSTLTYEITSEDLKEVSVVSDSSYSIVNLTIPASVTHPVSSESYSVKSIGVDAFRFHPNLTTVNMDSVEVIGESAFLVCAKLETVNMDTAKTIGESAFYGCTKLKTVNIDAVTTLSENAFYACTGLETVNMNSIEIISAGAFSGCKSLETVNIDQNSEYFEMDGGIIYNRGQTEVVLCPAASQIYSYTALSTVKTIGYNAFDSCADLLAVDLGLVETIRSGAFMDCTSLQTVEMDSVKTVGGNSFRGCTSLTTMDMNSVTTIGDFVFFGTMNVATLNMNSIRNISAETFLGCKGLRTVNIDSNNAYFEVHDDIVYNKGRTEVILCPPALPKTSYTAPSTVKVIWYNAFNGCVNLQTIDLGSAETIRSGAFSDCTSLQTVEMDSVKTVGEDAFRRCTDVSVMNMNLAENIGDAAFYDCTNLKTMNASSARTVGDYAFYNCSNLEIIVLREGTLTADAKIRASAIIIFSDQNIKINAERVSGDTNGDDLEIIITARAGYELIGEPEVRTTVGDSIVLINDEGGGKWSFNLSTTIRSVAVTHPVLEIEDLDPSSDPGVSPDLPSWAWILVVAIVLAVVIVIYVMYVRRK